MKRMLGTSRLGFACAKAIVLATALFLTGAVDANALAVPQPSASGWSSSGYWGYVKVSWSGVKGANKYYVYRATSSKWSKRVKIKTCSSSTRSFRDTSAKPGVTYWYWVCPARKPTWKNAYKSKSYHNKYKYAKGVRAIKAPKATASYDTYASKVRVSWSRVAYAKRYMVKRSTSPYYYTASKIGTTSATAYNDTSASPGTTYYYWVLPAGSNGKYWYNSATCNSSSDWGKGRRKKSGLTAPQPSAPSISHYNGAITICWTRVSGQYPSSYRIYRSRSSGTTPGNGATWIGTVSSSAYGLNSYYYYYDFDVSYYVDYYYWVCPVDSSGQCWYNASKYKMVWLRDN